MPSKLLYAIMIHCLSTGLSQGMLNSFTANIALMHPKKIVQSQFHLAKTHKLTNIVDLFYSFLSQIKYNIE